MVLDSPDVVTGDSVVVRTIFGFVGLGGVVFSCGVVVLTGGLVVVLKAGLAAVLVVVMGTAVVWTLGLGVVLTWGLGVVWTWGLGVVLSGTGGCGVVVIAGI